MSQTLTFVEGQFCATHCEPYGASKHGHDWWVRAFWNEGQDYRSYQSVFYKLLENMDHTDLNDLIGRDATNEGVARYLAENMDCVEVEVWRFEKGHRFGAVWRK